MAWKDFPHFYKEGDKFFKQDFRILINDPESLAGIQVYHDLLTFSLFLACAAKEVFVGRFLIALQALSKLKYRAFRFQIRTTGLPQKEMIRGNRLAASEPYGIQTLSISIIHKPLKLFCGKALRHLWRMLRSAYLLMDYWLKGSDPISIQRRH